MIRVKITVDKEGGGDRRPPASPQQPTNFSAPEPVTRAAVRVFRVMVATTSHGDECRLPAASQRIVIPPRSMLSPEYPAWWPNVRGESGRD